MLSKHAAILFEIAPAFFDVAQNKEYGRIARTRHTQVFRVNLRKSLLDYRFIGLLKERGRTKLAWGKVCSASFLIFAVFLLFLLVSTHFYNLPSPIQLVL